MKILYTSIIIATVTLFMACNKPVAHYTIGVSQCSEDIWRNKQNAEMKMETYFHDNVDLKFTVAYDSDKRQVQQIDSLVDSGIDLLVVAPNQVQTISPAIDRAYDKGIPIIVFERKTSSQKYTAFISADNYEMGKLMGEYIVSRLGGKGNVLEIMGLKGSSPAIERHKGFMDAISKASGIKVVGSLQGNWTEPEAYEITRQWLSKNKNLSIDLVFGANDRSAMGARRAIQAFHPQEEAKNEILFCGIDGLPGKDGGIQLVRNGLLDASYIYPTHGDQIINLAMSILEGKPYKKETMMMSAIVTRDNAKVLQMQGGEIMRQIDQLDRLHDKADSYLHELGTQRLVNWLSLSTIFLLLVVFVLFYLYYLRKISMQRERMVNTLWNMEGTEPQQTFNLSKIEKSSDNLSEGEKDDKTTSTPLPSGDAGGGMFLSRFREVVETRLNNSETSVDDLASDMNLSRVQLYRKIKAITGLSPVELLRSARLARAYQFLLTTDKNVSEVAYSVGFTAPGYFTKCFKEEYGIVPGDVKKMDNEDLKKGN
ncbi:AraC family transcriptional regulator [Prevotella koreensis]|nr:substrate-binding domain-containing protein [Prevotella koreensis]